MCGSSGDELLDEVLVGVFGSDAWILLLSPAPFLEALRQRELVMGSLLQIVDHRLAELDDIDAFASAAIDKHHQRRCRGHVAVRGLPQRGPLGFRYTRFTR